MSFVVYQYQIIKNPKKSKNQKIYAVTKRGYLLIAVTAARRLVY
jgi:hypothetical protein